MIVGRKLLTCDTSLSYEIEMLKCRRLLVIKCVLNEWRKQFAVLCDNISFPFLFSLGTPINKPPVLGYKDLNLFKLFRLVYQQGGCDNVSVGCSPKLNMSHRP